MSSAVAKAPQASKCEVFIDGRKRILLRSPLQPGETPPKTNEQQRIVTAAKVGNNWYASTCGDSFVPVNREPHLEEAPEIAEASQAHRSYDGSNGLRFGVVSFESLRDMGAEFTVRRLEDEAVVI